MLTPAQSIKIQQPFKIGNGQTKGLEESQNDYFATSITHNGTLAVVADGLGKRKNGMLSATLGTEHILQQFEKIDQIDDEAKFLIQSFQTCNEEILYQLNGAKGGASLAATLLHNGYMHWAAVGNIAIMVHREEEIIHINKKHIYWHELSKGVADGKISREKALSTSIRDDLTHYIGYEDFKDIERGEFNMQVGDIVVVCTDGVYNALSELTLEKLLSTSYTPYEKAQNIITAIKDQKRKKQDNATLVLVEM